MFTHIGVFTYTDLPLGRVGSATGLGSQFWGATAHCSCLLLEVGSWRGLCEGSFHCIPFYSARFIDILVHLVLTCSLLCNAVPYDANWTCACCSSVLHFRHTHTRMHAYSRCSLGWTPRAYLFVSLAVKPTQVNFPHRCNSDYYQINTDSSRPRALVCLVPDGCHALCLKICLSLRTSTVYSRPLLGVLFQVVHPFHSPGTFSYLLCSALVAGTSLISARPQNNVTRKRQRDSDRLSIPLHTAGHLHAPNFFGGYQNRQSQTRETLL